MKPFYTKEMIEFLEYEFKSLKLNCQKYSKYENLTYIFNQHFGTNQTKIAILKKCYKLGLTNYKRRQKVKTKIYKV